MNDAASLRRLLGWLLLWALLPLPFLYIVLPPFWLAAGATGAVLVLRPEWVPTAPKLLLNLLGIAILVVVISTGGLHIGPLRPLGHLLLLLTSVRVLLVKDRKGFLRALALIGMVWMVSVASSTHFSASLYFVASAAVFWWVGIRIHLDGLGLQVDDRRGSLPRPRHVLVAVLAALLVAVPFFIVMPRLGSPWIAGRSFGRSMGFSPDVDLGKLGRLTENQEVAVIVRSTSGARIRERWTRLRGTAFDQVMAGAFIPRRTNLDELQPSRGVVWLHPEAGPLDDLVELEIDLLRPRRYLMLPEETVAIQAAAPMALDLYGGVLVGYRRGRPLSYRVWVGDGASPKVAPPSSRDVLLPRNNPEVGALARSVAGGETSNRSRAEAIERFLQTEYDYSLESGVRISTTDPVAWFLLDGREGHCEFFAGAMVVMLRHLRVPARMVAGYSGGDISPDNDELVVREANAHAWVEAWLGPDEGWATFDPTPPGSVPGLGGVSGIERLRWAWQQLELIWDQKLLTFGLGEQMDLVEGAVELVRGAPELLRQRSVGRWAAWTMAVLVLAGALRLWWSRRARVLRVGSRSGRGPAGRAVGRLARALVPVGGVVPPWATVRTIGAQAAAFWPASRPAVAELVERAETELYGAGGDDDPAEIRRLWKRIRLGMKQRELRVDGSGG